MQLYPVFEELRIEDLVRFKEAFNSCPPKISEYTFSNLYAFRDAYKFKVTLLDDFIVLRSDLGMRPEFLDPIGTGDKKPVIEKILDDFKASFIRIPESAVVLFSDTARFKVEPDRDNFDYLYRLQDLIALAGRKYDGKRNQIKKFRSQNNYEYLPLDAKNIQECLSFEERWCTLKNCDTIKGLNNERRAIQIMAENFLNFQLIGGSIKFSGRISAVAVAQKLNQDTLVMHVLKADPSISGLYQTVLQEFLSKEAAGFTYVNLEQDLGQEGLRKSKESYHPVGMVKKYTAIPLA